MHAYTHTHTHTESAKGKYPVETVSLMNRIVAQSELAQAGE